VEFSKGRRPAQLSHSSYARSQRYNEVDEATAIIESIKDSRSVVGYEDDIIEMFETYRSQMKDAKVIDFQDIILNTNEALREKLLSPPG
jgi:superfamily I DNA/RNA helicase